MKRSPPFLSVLLLAAACETPPDRALDPFGWVEVGRLPGPAAALAEGPDRAYAAVGDALYASDDGGRSWQAISGDGLAAGRITALEVLPDGTLIAFVWGGGIFRSVDGGERWVAPEQPPAEPTFEALINPRLQYVPLDLATDPTRPSRVLLAGAGGLFRSEDSGASWSRVDAAAAARLRLLFFGAWVRGDEIYVATQAPENMIPPAYRALLDRGLLYSADGGAAWQDLRADLAARALTGVARDGSGQLLLTAMDGGLFRRDGASWRSLGGPRDAVGLSLAGGGVSVISATRGVWRHHNGSWTAVGDRPMAALGTRLALAEDGTVYRLVRGAEGGLPPESAGGTVHIALSFHGNLYHSFRGDTADDQGFGLDIRVMRTVLDWLDRYPEVRGDWDIDNFFSTDDLLPAHAPDVIARIAARFAAGKDGVRLMSWNNGAMVAETAEEFAISVQRAQQSLQATFGGYDPGVQPQETMFTPDHVGWYRRLGVEWITLFYAANPFTGFRQDVQLAGRALYNPLELRDGDDAIVLVPAYNIGDVLDHGGLGTWARQISSTIAGDTLLLIHMDADSEFWIEFDRELEEVKDLPFVRFTTIQDYLDRHPPVADVTLAGDIADGRADGFSSWAEKDVNHEIATAVMVAREDLQRARAIAGDDPGVAALVAAARDPLLVTLSTTHFGLASPYLVPERVVKAREWAALAEQKARAALAAAEGVAGAVPAGTLEVVNVRDAGGTALVELALEVPAAAFDGSTAGLVVLDGAEELAADVAVGDAAADPVRLDVRLVLPLAARQRKQLAWRYDPQRPSSARGAVGAAALEQPLPLGLPFTECAGVRAEGVEQLVTDEVGARKLVASRRRQYALDLCDGAGTVTRTRQHFDGLAGAVVTVSATLGSASDPERAESVALTPLACAGPAASLTWRTFGGAVRTRPVRPLQASWNGQAVDGWIALGCSDGQTIQVSHQVTVRSSLAFAPLRNIDGRALLAPLGTLWGIYPRHDARRTGGHGIGGVIVGMLSPQMRPAAPDWSGKVVRYRLLVGEQIDAGTLDLFAHPPYVRVGAYRAP